MQTIDTTTAESAVPSDRTRKAYGLPRIDASRYRAYVKERCAAEAARTVGAMTRSAVREAHSSAREARVGAAQAARGVVTGSGPARLRRHSQRALGRAGHRAGRGRARSTAACDAPEAA